MPLRKRVIDEVEEDDGPADTPLLDQIRSMWEFACLMQYIYLFGEVVKIRKEIDVETLETECCKPSHSDVLSEIGLALLKFVSSHRGLTPDIFDEFARRQYVAKAPERNPFGTDEEPSKFADFDVFLKIRILHQLSVWTLHNPDRIRQQLADDDQTSWRVEEYGWDAQDRSYYILDDSRLYRLTKPVIPEPPKPRKKPTPKKRKGQRASKRQKLLNGDGEDEGDHDASVVEEKEQEDNGLGGAKWECVAITLDDYNYFLEGLKRSRDPEEKALYKRMTTEIIPEIERQAEARERRAASKRKELENLQRLATAKRSSRIADKQEKMKEQQEAEEVERKRQDELAMARKEQEKQRKMEQARESRIATREQRLKEREVKRIVHEQEIAKLEAQSEDDEQGEGRISERQRQVKKDKAKQQLEEWTQEDEEWYFDCAICGVHGKNLDDGSHSLACDKCNVWQHSACHGIKEEDAERDDFHFICSICSKPKPKPLKIRLANSASPKQERSKQASKQHINGEYPPRNDQHYHHATNPFESLHPSTSPASHRQHGYPYTNGYYGQHPPQVPGGAYGDRKPPNIFSTSPSLPMHNDRPRYSPTGAQNTWPNYPYSPQQRSNNSSHNPYAHNFGRQKPMTFDSSRNIPSPFYPYENSFSFQPRPSYSPQSRPAYYDNNVNNHNNTPNADVKLPPINASPTPSISATQGNTDVRFSPASHNTANPPSPHANTYIPVSNHPTASAYSPTKQPSTSPPAPLPPPQTTTFDASTKPSIASLLSNPTPSPVKHDPVAPPPPTLPPLTQPPTQTPTSNLHAGNGPAISPPNAITLPPAPSLSPNIGLENRPEPPVKKPSPLPQGPPPLPAMVTVPPTAFATAISSIESVATAGDTSPTSTSTNGVGLGIDTLNRQTEPRPSDEQQQQQPPPP